jgi:hypothetical protein
VAANWRYAPDPDLEPMTEIASVHGSSESADSPLPIQGGIAGNFVRDALDRGYRLGFVGSGDSHDGHPGLAHLAVRRGGGLAAILAGSRTREGVYEALRARRAYATNGARIWLEVELEGRPMGAAVPAAPGGAHEARVEIAAESALARVEWIRRGGAAEALALDAGARELSWRGRVPGLAPGEYLYLRAVQADGGAAWSSPFFADAGDD